MANAELKTKATNDSVEKFIGSISNAGRQKDCRTVLALMQKATGAKPKMWGAAIVGFGDFHYKYASGREGDWFLTGFSPRKQNLTLYLMNLQPHKDILAKLGKHKTAKGCLYINSLDDVDLKVLRQLIDSSVKYLKKMKTPSA
jgi:hypothetical protein